MLTFQTFALSALGGILPALLWLWFWLKEDHKNPEPNKYLFLAFLVGMVAVPLVIPFQQSIYNHVLKLHSEYALFIMFFGWAAVEEIFKFIGSFIVALRSKADDEPVDPIIYLITTALGFAALENALFLYNPISHGHLLEGVITGDLRFIGATLLHTAASATIGVFMALSFYKGRVRRVVYTLTGIIFSIALHTLFNLLIIKSNGGGAFLTFSFVWVAIIILMLFFEKIKHIIPQK